MPRRREEGPVKGKSGYYLFDQYVGYGPGRHRVRISLGTRNLVRAQWLWEQEFKRQWAEHYGLRSLDRKPPMLFSDAVREFIEYEREIRRVKEWKIFEWRLNIISRLWGKITLGKIEKNHLMQLDQFLKEKQKSPKTTNHYFGLLKSLFRWAEDKNLIERNPAKQIRPYVVDEKRRAYTREEIKRILKATEKIEKAARPHYLMNRQIKRLVELLLLTGMRFGEAINLRWKNIQGNKIVLERTETKQKKEKVIPITKAISDILKSLKGQDIEFIFKLRRRGKRVHQTDIIQRIRKESGIKDFIFHGLRHTAATRLASTIGDGVSLGDVMKILGHSQARTTTSYLHSDFCRMRKAMRGLERFAKK